MKEIWKRIPNWEDYEVSSTGKVRSFKYGKIRMLKITSNNTGALMVRLSDSKGGARSFYVAELVLMTFICFRPEGKEVSHLNNIQTDNRLMNLKWETHQENMNRVQGIKINLFIWQIRIIIRRKR